MHDQERVPDLPSSFQAELLAVLSNIQMELQDFPTDFLIEVPGLP